MRRRLGAVLESLLAGVILALGNDDVVLDEVGAIWTSGLHLLDAQVRSHVTGVGLRECRHKVVVSAQITYTLLVMLPHVGGQALIIGCDVEIRISEGGAMGGEPGNSAYVTCLLNAENANLRIDPLREVGLI